MVKHCLSSSNARKSGSFTLCGMGKTTIRLFFDVKLNDDENLKIRQKCFKLQGGPRICGRHFSKQDADSLKNVIETKLDILFEAEIYSFQIQSLTKIHIYLFLKYGFFAYISGIT